MSSEDWVSWNPISRHTTSYMPPGGWDPAWTHQDRHMATMLYRAAFAGGCGKEKAWSLAAMAVIKQRAPHTVYGDAWEQMIAGLMQPAVNA